MNIDIIHGTAGMFNDVFHNLLCKSFFPKKDQFHFQLLTTVSIQNYYDINFEKLHNQMSYNVENMSFRFVLESVWRMGVQKNILLLPF